MSKRSIAFIIFFGIFIMFTVLLFSNNISFFDKKIYSCIIYFKNPIITKIFKFFSFLCSVSFIIGLCIILLLLLKRKKDKFFMLINVLGCVMLNQFLKFIIRRPRPTGINLINENGYSFPSGHSMVSMAFYGFLIFLILNSRIKKERKIIFISFLSMLIIFVGISRIYLGVHYASDVLAGFSLSISYLLIISYFYDDNRLYSLI